ncbi:MAG: hypothetical protein JW910_06900, partial [Anaerolineae bacterium]|nr:hypothetical protein [Anaerolineae bacterium]
MTVVTIGPNVFDVKLYPERTLQVGYNVPAAIYLTPGGPSRNIAEALVRLGQEATLLGVVGDDLAGEVMLAATARAGVDVSHVQRIGGLPTYTYVALTTAAGEPFILTDGRIHDHFDAAYFLAVGDMLRAASVIVIHADLFQHFQAVRAQLALPERVRVALMAKYEDATPALRAALPTIDWLFLNHREAGRLWGREVGTIAAAAEAARWLLAQGVRLAIVTRGAEGFVAA